MGPPLRPTACALALAAGIWAVAAVAAGPGLDCTDGDCIDGDGAAVLVDDGTRLAGHWQDGVTGRGQVSFPDGSQVIGRWRLRPAGSTWDLEFPDRIAMQSPDGTRYQGELRVMRRDGERRPVAWGEGVRHGQAPLRETGTFRAGQLYQGLKIEADTDAFAGEFKIEDWRDLPSSHWSFDLFGADYEDLEPGPGGLIRGEMHSEGPDGLIRFGEVQQVPDSTGENWRYRPRLVGTIFILMEDGDVREDRCTVAANVQQQVRYTCTTVETVSSAVLPERARDALLEEDLRRADALLTQLLRLAPEQPDLIAYLGRVRQIRGEHEVAQDLFSRAAFLRPDDPMITMRLGVSEIALGRTAAGCARIESVVDEIPAARELVETRCGGG